jgi:trimeric autotransporter adhesin
MSTKTTFKRIALVAVASMGFGVLTSVAPASAATLTGSVSPVRVTFTQGLNGQFTQDATPQAQISWTAGAAHAATDTVTVTLTTAPSASARVQIAVATKIGDAMDAFATADSTGASAKLGAPSETATGVALTGQTTTNGKVAIQADTAGTFGGNLKVYRAGVLRDTVNFSFTTRGVVASYTAAVSAASVSPSGTSTHSVTLKDAAGNTTQPLLVDTFTNEVTSGTGTTNYSVTAASASSGVVALASTSLADGVASQTYTAGSSANTVATYTTTPAGTIGSLAAQALTITTDATTITTTAVTAWAVTAPADAAAQTGTIATTDDAADAANILTTQVRTGSATITASATSAAAAGSLLRFKAVASSGTVDGVAAATPQYQNATVSSLGKATVTFTVGGNALLNGQTLTISQVDVANTVIANTNLVVTQTNAAATVDSVYTDLGANLVRALGASTSIVVTVEDQFGATLGAGWTVRAFRTSAAGTLLSTATTDASGTATVTVSPLATVVTGGAETYVYTAIYPGVTSITATETTAITYTTTGGITSMSSAIVTQTGAGILTPVLHTTAATALTVLPAIRVAAVGYANDAVGDGFYTVSTATLGAVTDVSTAVRVTTTNVPANSTTYTADAGAALCASVATTTSCKWNAGVSTLTVAAGSSVYAYATTTGVHTITATSGDKTTTMKFYAYNADTNYYTLSATADSTAITTGQTGVVTINVKDIFGNAVDTASGLLTATASGKVRLAGQALTQEMATGVDGTFSFTVLADATAGSGTITIAPTTTGANAWGASYVAPTGAAAPVKSVTLTFTVTGATLKTVDDVAAAVEAAVAALKAEIAANKILTDAKIAAAEAAAVAASEAAADAAAEAIDAGNNAFDAATSAGEAADAATAAAEQAGEDATAAATAAGEAAVAAAEAAQEAAAEATDAANAATDAANASAEAADAATAAAQDAADAVAALSTQVSEMITALKKQITALTNLVIKIQKKVKA